MEEASKIHSTGCPPPRKASELEWNKITMNRVRQCCVQAKCRLLDEERLYLEFAGRE